MRLKLVFVIPSLRPGGAELFLLRLSVLAKNKYDVRVITISSRDGIASLFEECGIKVINLGCDHRRSIFRAIIRLREIIRLEQPDIIHSFLYYADILSGISTLGMKEKCLIWSIRGSRLAPETKRFKVVIQHIAFILSRYIPDLIISCSVEASNFHILQGYPKNKVIEIGNFTGEWTKDACSRSIFFQLQSPLSFVVGLAARYDLGKGHLNLALAVSEFLDHNREIEGIVLKFAGKGCGEKGKLCEDISVNNQLWGAISNGRLQIEYSDFLDQSQIGNWFESLDLYVMSSNSLEGFPNSLAEAVAIGLPSVATPIGASSDLLPIGNITLDSTKEEIFAGISSFYQRDLTERYRDTILARDLFWKRFSEEVIFTQYDNAWRGEYHKRILQ